MTNGKDIVVGIRLTADGDQLVGEVKLSKKEIDALGNSVQRTDRKTGKFAETAKTAARNVATLTAAAAGAAAAYSIKKTADFEKAISDLSAITGATGDQLKYLTIQAQEFGASTTMSASQAAEAFKLVASAKPDLLDNAAALSAVTRETIVLAEAAGITLPESARALGASLNQFNADADQSTRFINVLAAGAKFGASEISETAQALKESGTVAASANISFEATNALLQVLAGNAIKGSQAGTGLRGVILKLQNQANDGFNPAIVGINTALQNLQDAHLSTSEKMKLFGLEGITSAEILIKNADAVETLTGKLTGTSTAYEQASTRTDNLHGDWDKLTSVTEGLALAIGDVLLPAVRGITQELTDTIDHWRIYFNVISNADDQLALSVQITDLRERLQDLNENGLVLSGEWLSFSSSEAAVAGLTREIDGLVKRRQKLLTIPDKPAGNAGGNGGGNKGDNTGTTPHLPGSTASDTVLKDAAALTEQMDTAFLDMGERTAQRYQQMYDKLVGKGAAGTQALEGLTTAYSSWLDEQWTANDEKELIRQTAQDERVISLQQSKFERLAAMASDVGATEEEREINRYDRQVEQILLEEEQLRTALGDRFNLEEEFRQAKEQALLVHENNIQNIEKKSQTAQKKLWDSGLKGKAEVMGQVLSGMASMMQSGSRRMFEIGKVAAISEAVVTGAKTILSSMAWGADVGGPIGAAVAGAAAAIPVGIQIAKISSAKFGGGAASSSAPSVSVGGASFESGGSGQQSTAVQPFYATESSQSQQPTVVNNNYWNGVFVDRQEFSRGMREDIYNADLNGEELALSPYGRTAQEIRDAA